MEIGRVITVISRFAGSAPAGLSIEDEWRITSSDKMDVY